MRYCENCGARLEEGIRFCEECGAPVEDAAEQDDTVEQTAQEPPEVPAPETRDEPQRLEEEHTPAPLEPIGADHGKGELQAPGETRSGKGGRKKAGIIAGIFVVLLAAAGIALWQMDVFSGNQQPAAVAPVRAADPDDLYGTLDWKVDQDKEYALKNSLIQGNSDANVKEIFEESAYFTPREYKYASDGAAAYYQIACQYEKGKKQIPYVLVFRVNRQEHLELAELYKKEQKIDAAKFDSFYKKLYKTKADVEAAKAKKKEQAQAAEENPVAFLEGNTYSGTDSNGWTYSVSFGKCTKEYVTIKTYEGDYKLYFDSYNNNTKSYIFTMDYDFGEYDMGYENIEVFADDRNMILHTWWNIYESEDAPEGYEEQADTVECTYQGPNSKYF